MMKLTTNIFVIISIKSDKDKIELVGKSLTYFTEN